MNEAEVLGELLAAEHAATYAYGVIGAHLDEHRRVMVLAGYDAHRLLRDRLLARLRARDLATPGPALAYALPAGSPVQQAISLETDLCVLWRDLVAATYDADLRALAVRALADTAVRATRWRQAAGLHPVTVPWPGAV
ncbi:MAG: ferritin-like domain-containing protein [Mycobacteriales bacterium]